MSYVFHPAIGPIKRSKLDLMGIRFVDGADGNAPAATSVDGETTVTDTDGETTVTASNVQELPDWAQKIISDARAGEARYRNEAKTAAETAVKDFSDKFASALGIKEEAAADPEALAKSLSAAESKAQASERKLAIFQAAADTGADAKRLLDSNSFMTSVAQVDPADGAAITAAIQAAITANNTLKAVQAAAASGTELGGSGETGQITEAQLAQMTNEQIAAANKAGKLRHLLA